MDVAAEPEEDAAVVAAEAGAVEEAALRRHPLHHVHALQAKVARLAAPSTAVARGHASRHSHVLGSSNCRLGLFEWFRRLRLLHDALLSQTLGKLGDLE